MSASSSPTADERSTRSSSGDVKRGPGHTTGFARTLAPNKQLTVVLYLDYRGLLRYVLRTPTGTNIAKGVFRIT